MVLRVGVATDDNARVLAGEWVEALEVVFDKMCADWDAKEERGENADDGYYHPRKGARHLNPAFDLTSSGTTGAAQPVPSPPFRA